MSDDIEIVEVTPIVGPPDKLIELLNDYAAVHGQDEEE